MKELIVSATGVTHIQTGCESDICVNAESLIDMIDQLVCAAHPKTDYYDQFAARVTITVELLGDLEESGDE